MPPPPPPRVRADNTHRHGGISLPPAPQWGSGIIHSLGGCETKQPEAKAESHGQGKDAQVQAETQPLKRAPVTEALADLPTGPVRGVRMGWGVGR